MLNLNSVMVGLQYLFLEPNADDPLNKGEVAGSGRNCSNAFNEQRLLKISVEIEVTSYIT